MAYENTEPFGEWRADFRSAQLCAVMTNSMKGVLAMLSGKKPQSYASVEDFMLQSQLERSWNEEQIDLEKPVPPKQQSIEEMKQVLYAIAKYSKKAKKINPKRRKRR